MEYQVPQFIEVEDKIIGPLTIKQFIYLAGGAGVVVAAAFYLPLILAALVALPVGGLAIALAFYKMNGKAFVEILEAAFLYYTREKMFLWKRQDAKEEDPQTMPPALARERAARGAPRLTNSKLHELAWSLDIKLPSGETSS